MRRFGVSLPLRVSRKGNLTKYRWETDEKQIDELHAGALWHGSTGQVYPGDLLHSAGRRSSYEPDRGRAHLLFSSPGAADLFLCAHVLSKN